MVEALASPQAATATAVYCAAAEAGEAEAEERRRQESGGGREDEDDEEDDPARDSGRAMIRLARIAVSTFAIGVSGAAIAAAQTADGAALFVRECARCHTAAGDSRAPTPDVLRKRSPEGILSALTAGSMRPQGGRLNGAERRAVAEYLSGRSLGGDVTGIGNARCRTHPPLSPAGKPMWGGWSPSSTNTRLQSTAQAGLTAADVPKLTLKWAFGFPDATSAWSQPTVAGGRVFVGSQNGTVYALDVKTGCVQWTYTAAGGVRTAPTFGARPGSSAPALYFGDTGANVYAVDADSGELLWKRRVDAHPFARVTGTPTLHDGRLYVPISSLEETAANQPGYECCTFRGSLMALNARTGDIVWQTYTIGPSQAMGKNAAGTTPARTVRGRHLVGADHRREAQDRLRRHRQHLQRPGGRADLRRHHGVRPRNRRGEVDETADRR